MNWSDLKKKVKKLDSNIYINDDCFALHITSDITLWCWKDKDITLSSDNYVNFIRIKIKKMNSYEDIYKLCKILTVKEKNNEQNKNN